MLLKLLVIVRDFMVRGALGVRTWWRMTVKNLRGLNPEDRDYVLIYGSHALFGLTYFAFTPAVVQSVLQRSTTALWLSLFVVGGAVAIYGIVYHRNLTVEYAGVWLLIAGPAGLGLIQIGLLVNDVVVAGSAQRAGTIVLALVIVMWLRKRIRYLRRRRKLAKSVPLEQEAER